MCGYIKLHRQILEWGRFEDHNTFRVFIYLLLKASSTNRVFDEKPLKKGQLITSRKSLSEKLGLSEKEVRTCITKLKRTGEIDTIGKSKYTIITIKKWSKYQGSQAVAESKGPTKGQQEASRRPTKGHS
ncbi:MAG TPA: hypothetical protein DCL21_05660 [Alphaproteobacteria bacterium]|nr:hypothetical protein [Alphaproteobacteria bacterium]